MIKLNTTNKGHSDIMYFQMWCTEKDTTLQCSIPAKNAWSEFGHEEIIKQIFCKRIRLYLQQMSVSLNKKPRLKENKETLKQNPMYDLWLDTGIRKNSYKRH